MMPKLGSLCVLLCFAPAHSVVYHAYPSEGASALCECMRRAAQPGDECRLHAGRYEVGPERCQLSGLHGTRSQPIIVAAAGDGPVVVDGTVAIQGPWRQDGSRYAAESDGLDILQLFVDGELQVLARFPNARWSDRSVFYGVENWLRSKKPGSHNLTTGKGVLRDNGACASPEECCSKCNTHQLKESEVNATGALAIVNLWKCDTGVERILLHEAADPNALKYDATWKGLCDSYENGDGRYYLEGLPAFLDDNEEWIFDAEAKRVLMTAPPQGEVRGRVSDYALVISDASFVHFANLSFHASTMSVTGDVGNLTFTSLHFNYSSVSRRALGDPSPPNALNIFRTPELDATDPAPFVLDDVIIRYSDGPALLLSGAGSVLQDCLFEWNDYTAVGGSWPLGVEKHGKANRAQTVRTWGGAHTFRRLTFRNNGAAHSLGAYSKEGQAPSLVEMCSFSSQLSLQDDGAFVEGGGVGGTTSTSFVRNWLSNTGRHALRWDSYYPNTNGGRMYENVAWNTSWLIIKGDDHNVSRNTVFDGADIAASHAAHDRPRYQDHTSDLNNVTRLSAAVGNGHGEYDPRANNKSVFECNIFDSWESHSAPCPQMPCVVPGQHRDNLIGTETSFNIKRELRDPFHLDFRPCPASQAASLAAGAYPTYSSSDAAYWIPGRRERTTASTPVPPTGSISVHSDTELMFLPAVFAAGHSVYLGKADEEMTLIQEIEDAKSNIARPPLLDGHVDYQWRVDTHLKEGGTVAGQVWSFTTRAEGSCKYTSDANKVVI